MQQAMGFSIEPLEIHTSILTIPKDSVSHFEF